MKEKRSTFGKDKKSNDNPFAPYLFEDEKILWMDGSRGGIVSNDRKAFTYISVAALTLWFIAIAQVGGVSVAMSTSCGCLFLIAMVYVLAALWPIAPKSTEVPNKGLYALTNRHLFAWDGEHVTERALENISYVHLEPGAGSQGTLMFGNDFPAMPNIDDAAYVKTMIENARKHRLEEDL